jgi:excisionase family DNA binding protein
MSAVAEAPALSRSLDVKEVAALLKLNYVATYRLAHQGKIPGMFKVGRMVRFSHAAIEKFLAGPAAE